ncbi:MAG: hypothetical protein JW807_00895 [Spirochaetes bacterium]|nr:hypothetical protein [Spirochaetota bacterium]
MIPATTIKNAVKLVAAYVGITFIRAEQDGDRPALPFMEYKITGQPQDPAETESTIIADKEGDETKVIATSQRHDRAIVSLSFFGNDYTNIWSRAELARDYLESEAGKEALFTLGVFPRLLGPETSDRTSFLETSYEYRVGFDVAFEGTKEKTEELDAIDLPASVASIELQQ